MTAFEALSLVAQFSLSLIAILTLIVTIVVFLNNKKK
ncbi:putative holin-like toxin [Virgibacillus sp. W0181]